MFFERWQAEMLVGQWFRTVRGFGKEVPIDCLGQAVRVEKVDCGFKIVIAFYYANFSYGISPHDHSLNRRQTLKYLQSTAASYQRSFIMAGATC